MKDTLLTEDTIRETFGEPLYVDLLEVAPKGYEKVVKKLKKSKSVKNPWALAWSLKKKGVKPKKK